MNRIMTFNFKNAKYQINNILKSIIENRITLLITLLFTVGLWCGTAIYSNNVTRINEVISPLFNSIIDSTVLNIFIALFAVNSVLIFISFFSGFYAFGLPSVMLSPCLFGLFIGVINAWLYSGYGLNGVFFVLINIIPFSALNTVLLIFICNKSLVISSKTAKAVLFSETTSRGEVSAFFICYLIVLGIVACTSVFQSFLISKLTEKLLII